MSKVLASAVRRHAPCSRAWLALVTLSSLLAACGGGGSGSSGSSSSSGTTYSATGGVAQKGPLIKGSAVTAQSLDANLSPTGQQYTYQVTSNLGTFAPTSAFTSEYVGVAATGYYFDEVENDISSGTITLYGYSDLAADGVMNVNLLTTLAYQRIRNLVANSHMTFAAARTEAEGEVLTALHIPAGSYGAFGTLDLSGTSDGDHILAAMSSLFVYGHPAGQLSVLVANFQNDLGTYGRLTDPATSAALVAAAGALNPAQIAANLNTQYASFGVTFSASDITDWIDQDGDGVVGKFKFQVADATPASVFTLPSSVLSQLVGKQVSAVGGQLAVNGTPVTDSITLQSGDVIAVSTSTTASQFGMVNVYVLSGGTRVARVSFVNGLQSLAITLAHASVPKGLTQQLTVTGTFSDSGAADLTSSVQWTSASPSVAMVGASGLLQAQSLGSATITATLGSVSTSQIVTVTAAALEAIAITPTAPATGVGLMRQLAATGTYSDGTTADLTSQATWTSSTPAVASIGGGTGLVTGISLGSTNITAKVGSLTSTVPLQIVAGVWTPASATLIAHAYHTATLLPNGNVLVIGGQGNTADYTADAEIYHPLTDTWTPAPSLPTGIGNQTATLLNDGTVLVAGGNQANLEGMPGTQVEIYDPVTNTWTQGPDMISAHASHTATLLPSGKVLVAAGFGITSVVPVGPISSAEIYDPVAKTWSPAASLPLARVSHSAMLLASGTVLVAAGRTSADPSGAQIMAVDGVVYDPASDHWTATGNLVTPRSAHTTTLLANGKVMLTGGRDINYSPLANTEIYDPATNSWSAGGNLLVARGDASATLLPTGKIMIVGGAVPCPPTGCPPGSGAMPGGTSELLDPVANTSAVAANLNQGRFGHTATLMANGVLLVVGGYGANPIQTFASAQTPTAELYW
ncbi:MAG TPA: kelch repeat-containing protein [Steroidobacteraceae bacterium]|nr:kelch repeat-containing protein [Steroidobacteraceae bacterium]